MPALVLILLAIACVASWPTAASGKGATCLAAATAYLTGAAAAPVGFFASVLHVPGAVALPEDLLAASAFSSAVASTVSLVSSWSLLVPALVFLVAIACGAGLLAASGKVPRARDAATSSAAFRLAAVMACLPCVAAAPTGLSSSSALSWLEFVLPSDVVLRVSAPLTEYGLPLIAAAVTAVAAAVAALLRYKSTSTTQRGALSPPPSPPEPEAPVRRGGSFLDQLARMGIKNPTAFQLMDEHIQREEEAKDQATQEMAAASTRSCFDGVLDGTTPAGPCEFVMRIFLHVILLPYHVWRLANLALSACLCVQAKDALDWAFNVTSLAEDLCTVYLMDGDAFSTFVVFLTFVLQPIITDLFGRLAQCSSTTVDDFLVEVYGEVVQAFLYMMFSSFSSTAVQTFEGFLAVQVLIIFCKRTIAVATDGEGSSEAADSNPLDTVIVAVQALLIGTASTLTISIASLFYQFYDDEAPFKQPYYDVICTVAYWFAALELGRVLEASDAFWASHGGPAAYAERERHQQITKQEKEAFNHELQAAVANKGWIYRVGDLYQSAFAFLSWGLCVYYVVIMLMGQLHAANSDIVDLSQAVTTPNGSMTNVSEAISATNLSMPNPREEFAGNTSVPIYDLLYSLLCVTVGMFRLWRSAVQEFRSGKQSMKARMVQMFTPAKPKILLVGLDNSGKSTFLFRLKTGRLQQINPTQHPYSESVTIGKREFDITDCGGHEVARRSWDQYYSSVDCIFFFVDVVDKERLPEAKQELDNLRGNPELATVPIAVFGTKTDVRQAACTKAELSVALGLENLPMSQGDAKAPKGVRSLELFMMSIVRSEGYTEPFNWFQKLKR
ncbi:Sar1 GTPase with a very long N-terminal extension [Emiliania huxleyi CCMP1516]|uniref:Uncharacterized protein n=2 Tax=Emiliania huxleyi TaxID=2903 RepID=A0A0D3JC41_EMIH1|nr:Sar1 GTPase with a very long N-terminal extension [Emiliania huxleyi CCMP1516]EOD21076.1 Sar1 GTPase with a very long N-terminal extension [Emiliania huxleyi CCMP1516]|eukprot:XP_005773505.1 Sar1 GTPase with a very long N-terminal extension [Emiliania huxleyi CCMP1516]